MKLFSIAAKRWLWERFILQNVYIFCSIHEVKRSQRHLLAAIEIYFSEAPIAFSLELGQYRNDWIEWKTKKLVCLEIVALFARLCERGNIKLVCFRLGRVVLVYSFL